MMYVQDYDETYPYIRFHGADTTVATQAYVWRNAIRPDVKNVDVFACPSNPASKAKPAGPRVPDERLSCRSVGSG